MNLIERIEGVDAVKLGAQICGGITIDQYKANVAALKAFGTASEQRGYDRAIAEVVARMKRIEPDEEAAGCPASWGDFLQILESVAIEAGEHSN